MVADGTAVEIKSRVAGRTVAVAADSVDPIGGRASGGRRAERSGSRMLLHTADSDPLLRAAPRRHPDVRDIEIGSARLEDAFLALTPTRRSMSTTRHDRPPTVGPSSLHPALHYTVHSTDHRKNWSFVLFAVGMPVVLYLVFSQIFAGDGDGYDWSAMIMVSMAAYGSLGAAMGGGAQLAVERRSGWFRQLTITALPRARSCGPRRA